MRIGILKSDDVHPDLVDQFGEYPEQFAALLSRIEPALEHQTYEVQHGEYPREIDEVDAYLITGSKRGVYDDLEWIDRLADFVRRLHQRRKKLVGICFGHQLIAHSLGGKTERSDKGWGIGVHSVKWYSNTQHGQAGRDIRVLVLHADQVTEPAVGARVLAGSDFCPNAVCQLGDHILSFQGHPEFVKEYCRRLIEMRRAIYGEALCKQGISSLEFETDEVAVAKIIVDFIRPATAVSASTLGHTSNRAVGPS